MTRHYGIPVTSPARTLVDLADVLPSRALERALAEAEIRRLVTGRELTALVTRSPGRRGALAALVARDVDAPTRSELEDRFLAFLHAGDLPRPLVNQRIDGFEVDFHWPDARLVVELDGFACHSTRHAFEVDRARDAALQAAGWRVVRITHRRLAERPGEIAAQLRRLLRPARAPDPP